MAITQEKVEKIVNDDFFERIPNLRKQRADTWSHAIMQPGETAADKCEFGEAAVDKCEFILLVLGMMDKIRDSDVILAAAIFDM